jgi:hypothetical protein
MALDQFAPNQYRLTVGADDTEDGIAIFVGDEAFARVSISAAGIAVGDGTEAPVVPVDTPSAAAEDDGTYLLLATVTDGAAVYTFVDSADYVNA